MIYIVIGIAGLLLIVALFTFFFGKRDKESDEIHVPDQDCCGAHAICEKGLKKADSHIEYFDDEELDGFHGIPEDQYTPEQLEQFRDILYSLRKEEIGDWFISLEKREICFPEQLKAEALGLINE